MRTANNSNNTNSLTLDSGLNLRYSEIQGQPITENKKAEENFPGLKINSVYPEQKPVDTGSPIKSKLCIKNMVSIRCKMVVKAVLENLEMNYSNLELGEVEIIGKISDTQHAQLKSDLLKCGLELMEDKKIILVEKIKAVLIEMIHYSDELPDINFSVYLSQKLDLDYIYLSNLFAEVKGISIQQFIITHKIERVKELLVYGELSLSEIAWKLQYSSVAHLSNQFKKVTGLTPSHFKIMRNKRHIALAV